jgi:5-methylcytosine-specific restriction endonuclease McrA
MHSEATTSAVTRLELIHGLCAHEVGEQLRRASDDLGINKRRLAFYLFDMSERRLHQVTGHASVVHFAEAQLDMDARRTREHIQVGRSLQSLQLIDDAFCTGEISWSRVVMLLPVVQRETQLGWLDYAKTATCRDLRAEVAGCRQGDLPGEGSDYGLIHLPVNFEGRLSESDRAWVEQARMLESESTESLLTDTELLVKICRARVLDGGHPPSAVPSVPPSTASPSASSAHDVADADRNSEEVPDATRAEVLRRDKHLCRNCGCHINVQVHHMRARKDGGDNHPHNLLTLCDACHAAAHRDQLRISGNPDVDLCFHSSNGNPIQRGGRPPSPSLN